MAPYRLLSELMLDNEPGGRIERSAKTAVLAATTSLKGHCIPGASAPIRPLKHRFEQVRYSWEKLTKDTGITSEDVQRRMCDFGMHYWTSHHPWMY